MALTKFRSRLIADTGISTGDEGKGRLIPEVIRELGAHKAIYYFHAKDTQLIGHNVRKNGVLDPTSFTNFPERSWSFRTLGYGHDAAHWKKILAALKVAGYDDSISIEHEDGLMSPKEGLEKAVAFMKECVLRSNNEDMFWA